MEAGHTRRSAHLRDYDYTSPGAYFVTICARQRGSSFGEITAGEMRLAEAGQVAEHAWQSIPQHFPHVTLDAFVFMPDHMHGILVIADRSAGLLDESDGLHVLPENDVGTRHLCPQGYAVSLPNGERFGHPVSSSLPTIVRSYKAAVSKQLNEARGRGGEPIWQPGYYEHVVCNDDDLNRIRAYIADNPARWEETKGQRYG